MYFPSTNTYQYIKSQQVGIWIERYEREQLAVLLKLPSTIIKAIALGCEIDFIIGLNHSDQTYITLGAKIYESTSPLMVAMPLMTENEITSLILFTNATDITISIFDEIDSPVFGAKILLNEQFKKHLASSIKKYSPLNPTENIIKANKNLDSFYYKVDKNYQTEKHHEVTLVFCKIKLQNPESILIISHSNQDSINYRINTGIEGETQEDKLSHALKSHLKDNIFHSPQVLIGKKTRELTDILVLKNNYSILIESKALSIDSSNSNESKDKLLSRTLKQSHKAITQLEGALKAINRQEKIKSKTGDLVEIKNNNIYLIIVISEFIQSIDWLSICNKSIEIYKNYSARTLVIDISEFVYMLKLASSGNRDFGNMLEMRFNLFMKHRSYNIKSTDSSLPSKISS